MRSLIKQEQLKFKQGQNGRRIVAWHRVVYVFIYMSVLKYSLLWTISNIRWRKCVSECVCFLLNASYGLISASADSAVAEYSLTRPQVDLMFQRFRFLAPCQRLLAIVCVLCAHLRNDKSLTCVCLRLREQCLCSEITLVARVAHVLLLHFVTGNVGMNTPACKRSQLIGNTAIVRKRCVIRKKSTCVCLCLSVAAFTRKRWDLRFDLWQTWGDSESGVGIKGRIRIWFRIWNHV